MKPDLDQHLVTLADGSADDHAKGIALEAILDGIGLVWGRWARTLGFSDARQEAAIIIMELAPSYDPSRPARPFVKAVVHKRLASVHAATNAKRRRPELPLLELDALNTTGPSDLFGHTDAFVDLLADDHQYDTDGEVELRDEVGTAWRALSRRLTKLERRAVVGHAKGYNYEEIAAMIGGTVKQVDNAIERGKFKRSNVGRRNQKYGHAKAVTRHVYETNLVSGTVYSVKIGKTLTRPKTIHAGPFATVEEAVVARDQLLREQ